MPPDPHVHVGVGAWIVENNRLLMVRRAGAHGAGDWSVPGGWIDYGETPDEAVEREVLEETGIVCVAIRRLGFSWGDHPEVEFSAATLWIECGRISGDGIVTEPDKCPQVDWVPLDDVNVFEMELFAPLADWITHGCAGSPWRRVAL